jgi:hypothetical protein
MRRGGIGCGGVKKNRMFITTSRSLYSVYMEAQALTP